MTRDEVYSAVLLAVGRPVGAMSYRYWANALDAIDQLNREYNTDYSYTGFRKWCREMDRR